MLFRLLLMTSTYLLTIPYLQIILKELRKSKIEIVTHINRLINKYFDMCISKKETEGQLYHCRKQ